MNVLGNINVTNTKPAAVEVRGLAKHYGSVVALQEVNISIGVAGGKSEIALAKNSL